MSTYTEIFDTMVFTLNQFVQSNKPLGTKEIGHQLGVSHRTAQGITKALEESGWLDSEMNGCSKLYFASEKAKHLFGVNK